MRRGEPIFVSDIVKSGYGLPFRLVRRNIKNSKSAFKNSYFAETAILKLLKGGKIGERADVLFCVNLLPVVDGIKKETGTRS